MQTKAELPPTEGNVYEQRFRMLMKLIRIDQMLRNAEVKHKQTPPNGSAG